jgi:outer membrane protein assembly factor BamA
LKTRALLPLVAFVATSAFAQQHALVEKVEIAGNRLVPAETLLFYVSTKPGERYTERRLNEDFRRLWSTGLLEDVRLRSATARPASSSRST